jgi:pyrimidine-nucleoside phosphorylase
MNTTTLGWAVQRTGAGREKAGEPVDGHAGILFHKRYGAKVEKGELFATIYASDESKLDEPVELIKRAIKFSAEKPAAIPLVSKIITKETAEKELARRN